MDPTLIDLDARSGQFISENSQIPPDIIFKFPSAGGGYEEVAAHKMILSMVSLTFRNMFFVYDTEDRTANQMVLEATAKVPFRMMIDAIYNIKSMKASLQGKPLNEVFAVLNLVTMYEVQELVLAVKKYLSSFPITEDNALQIADKALEYTATFEEASHCLLLACAKFLRSNLSDAESFNQFVVKNGDRMGTLHRLAVLMQDLPPPEKCCWCNGCKRKSTICENGETVTAANVKVGVKVIRKRYYEDYREEESQGVGVVVRKDERKKNRWFIRWENNVENGDWHIPDRSEMFLHSDSEDDVDVETEPAYFYFNFKCH